MGIFTDMGEVLKTRKELEETYHQPLQSQEITSIGQMGEHLF
ncbi:MAG: hypothetical protein ACOWYE_13405 [Desulfatiglandales bacterium]